DEAAEPVEVAEARADAEAAAADNGVAAGPGQLADITAAHLLQRAIRGERNDLYEEFSRLVAERPVTELNDLLELAAAPAPLPLEEVEPASEIVRRFSTGAMSHGALSKEAHETLAQAMN